jgi:hypothetical protein
VLGSRYVTFDNQKELTVYLDSRQGVSVSPKASLAEVTFIFSKRDRRTSGPATFCDCKSGISVAVGTIITDRPPHRTVRAALPHTAPTLEDWRAMLLLAHRTILGHSLPRTVSG